MAMKILTTMLVEKVVYWGTPVSDGRGGAQVNAPVELNGRWEDVEQAYRDPTGQERLSLAVVATESPDGGVGAGADLKVGGYLYRGTLASLQDSTNPLQIDDAHEIRKAGRLPTLKGDQFLRQAWL